MKAHKFIFFFTLLFATVCTYAQEITPSDTPNETQKAMLKRGYGMFIHFGVNTFFGRRMVGRHCPRQRLQPDPVGLRPMGTGGQRCRFPLCSAHHQASRRFCPVGQQIYRLRMWLPHPSRRMWWVKYPKPAKNTVCNLPSIIHCGTATNPYTKGKILANTLTICRIN